MRVLFFTISIVVIYRIVLDFILFKDSVNIQIVAMLKYIGSLALIAVICLSIRDSVKNIRR
jgi:NhaP-type Na+/H+ or K+/H+ antiporter